MSLHRRLRALERAQAQHEPPPAAQEPASRQWLRAMEILLAVRPQDFKGGVLPPHFLQATKQFGEAAALLRGYVASRRLGPQTEYYCGILLGYLATEVHAARQPPAPGQPLLTQYLGQHDLVEELQARFTLDAYAQGSAAGATAPP